MNRGISRMRAAFALAMIITLVTGLTPTFAAGQPAKASATVSSQSKTSTKNKTGALTDKQKEAQAIKKYGYYKGKNATRIPVITYHNVVSDQDKKKSEYRYSSLVVSRSQFFEQMKWLHDRNYRTISCEEFYLWYKGKIKLPPKTVLITFDDGYTGVGKHAMPILQRFNMKGTCFVIGINTASGKHDSIKCKYVFKLSKQQKNLEFQSHTFHLHTPEASRSGYKAVYYDSLKMKKVYGFEYVAYPFGRNNKSMRKAYKDTGMKLAFTYGDSDYATRWQDIYQIRRIKIYGNRSLSDFTKWFK